MKETQEIYINMDDSGVLHFNDKYCIYGGLVFTSKLAQDTFIRKYLNILNKIKCHYCQSNITKCLHICPEIKDANIKAQDKRRIWNLIKKEMCYAVVIENQKISPSIMNDKFSRGRYRDFAQRLIIKKILDKLIKEGKIDAYAPIKLIIRIDQQATVTNTNRSFIKDIEKELTMGMTNFEYNTVYKPIIYSSLKIDLKYVLSHKHLNIQASDFIAGETRRNILMNYELEYLNIKLFLP